MVKLQTVTIILVLASFGIKKKHSLTVLLSLEFLGLLIIVLTILLGLDMFFALMMICVGACEGAVGLSALISMTRMKSQHSVEV